MALHDSHNLPWDYEVQRSQMFLRSYSCLNNGGSPSASSSTPCNECLALPQNNSLKGIINRINNGVNERSPYAYHGIGNLIKALRRKDEQNASLRKRGLNLARSLVVRSMALSYYKRFMIAIGSGEYHNVERLVRISLSQKKGIRGILSTYEDAANKLYNPKSYTERESLLALLLWRLGGGRLAGIVHRAMGLPHTSTIRHRHLMPPLIPSHTMPSSIEIKQNITACFEAIQDVLSERQVVHQILMLDEIATEKRIRWDERSNCFLGVCRAHGHATSLEFSHENDLNELFKCLEDGEVHYAGEVRV